MARQSDREQRKITFVKAHMALGGEWVEVQIGNISPHGMMLKCAVPPAVGTTVMIRRRAAGAIGVVQWVQGRRCGIYCAQALDQQAFVAESAKAAAPMDAAAMQPPRFVERLWHWRRHGSA